MEKKHNKHAKLTKPSYGKFARNEWAIIGAPCDVIRELVHKITAIARVSILYIDESHDHNERVSETSTTTKKGDAQEFRKSMTWDKYENYISCDPYDIVLVNGNHFKADKQIVILDPRKKESLSRKLDRLDGVSLFLTTPEQTELYDFLEDETSDSIPRISISDVEGLWKFINEDRSIAKLKGIVLAGGKSTRMGKDKGKIDYHGKAQVDHVYEMLESLEIDTYVSCREDQSHNYGSKPKIHDKFNGLGPFGAIASAFMNDPNCAWLVLPCDLPLLERDDIKTLTIKRNPYKYATAFLNNETHFPEPLVSIWEPKMYQRMLIFLAQGYSCPRKVLINSDVELIHVDRQEFMLNANTPEDMKRAQILLEEG